VLYEMATGQLPFRGEGAVAIFDAILNRDPIPPVRLNPGLPLKLEEIVNKALEKDRNLRYQHASDIRTDLQRLKRDKESVRSFVTSTTTKPSNGGKERGVSESQTPIAEKCTAVLPSTSEWTARFTSAKRLAFLFSFLGLLVVAALSLWLNL